MLTWYYLKKSPFRGIIENENLIILKELNQFRYLEVSNPNSCTQYKKKTMTVLNFEVFSDNYNIFLPGLVTKGLLFEVVCLSPLFSQQSFVTKEQKGKILNFT